MREESGINAGQSNTNVGDQVEEIQYSGYFSK